MSRAECNRRGARKYRLANPELVKSRLKAIRDRYRRLCIEHYGPNCKCCNESIFEFLCIDHIYGGGSKHRKELGLIGKAFYAWLIKENFPEGFQTLCHNCNQAKSLYGVCPHQRGGK